MKKIGRVILPLFFLMQGLAFCQEVQLIAKVSKKKLGENQRFMLEYEINHQDADHLELPDFKNFKIVGGPSQSISNSYNYVNGKVKQRFSKTYAYVLEPLRKGIFTLSSATIQYQGKTIKSNQITVEVVDVVNLPKNPNDPEYIASQNVKILVTISNQNPYLGEPIYVEYRLYIHQVSINDFKVDTPPNYEGFWSQILEDKNIKISEDIHQGELWKYATLHKVVLIPQREGDLILNPMLVNLTIGVPTGKGDFFGNMITHDVNRKIKSKKEIINVKTLPSKGKPIDFNGAVGDYTYEMHSSRKDIKSNESAQIKVKVSGRGNLKLFELPKIKTSKGLEVYDPERKEEIKVTHQGLSGSIENSYTIVPQYKGKFKIPETTFSFFSVKDKKYHTINAEAISLNILEGKEISTTEFLNPIVKQQVKKGDDFRYIQTSTFLKSIEKKDFYKSSWFYSLLLFPLIAIPIGYFLSKKQIELSEDVVKNRMKKANKLARKYLFSAKKELGDKDRFYFSLEKALHNYLKAKLGVEMIDISKDGMANLLNHRNVPEEVIGNFLTIFNSCELVRYGQLSSNEDMEEDFDKAKKAILELDKII